MHHHRGLGIDATFAGATMLVAVSVATTPPAVAQDDAERLFWESVRCEEEREIRLYLEEYPRGAYVDEAIECLRGAGREEPETDDDVRDNEINERLNQCEAHIEANRLTSGAGGNALECYRSVLQLDADNPEALAGLARIEDIYAQWTRSAIEAGRAQRAQTNLDKLKKLNPEHRSVGELEQAISELKEQIRRAQREQEEAVEAQRQAERAQEEAAQALGQAEHEQEEAAQAPGQAEREQEEAAQAPGQAGREQEEAARGRQPIEPEMVRVDDFSIGKYEVTQGQWEAVMGDNPSNFKQGDDYPVENVSWNDARNYIQKLNARTGKTYRLPTDDEWERACLGGGPERTYCGGEDVDAVAWYLGNSNGSTHPVGQKKPNRLGIHDMSGNVWEWTSTKHFGVPVLRGGSWNDSPRIVRSTHRPFRPWHYAYGSNFHTGVRLARD